jgi:hypothetical protein
MNDKEQLNSMELIQKAKEFGLLESNLTLTCVQCNAVFPKEYFNCPQCNLD